MQNVIDANPETSIGATSRDQQGSKGIVYSVGYEDIRYKSHVIRKRQFMPIHKNNFL